MKDCKDIKTRGQTKRKITGKKLTWKNSISSPNTLKKYTGSVEIYCGMVFGKKPDELTRDDFKNLRYSDTINKFVKPLRDKDINIKDLISLYNIMDILFDV